MQGGRLSRLIRSTRVYPIAEYACTALWSISADTLEYERSGWTTAPLKLSFLSKHIYGAYSYYDSALLLFYVRCRYYYY
jgi:hypothetical protein